jgi:serine/threonine protein kinase
MPRIENPEAFRNARREDVSKKAGEVVASELARSSSLDPNALAMIPSFSISELTFGRVVGRGGFCVVHELVAMKLKEKAKSKKSNFRLRGFASHGDVEGSKSLDTTTREYLARRIWSRSGKYVTKRIEPLLWETDRVSYLKGVIDLALEMHFLASLNHVHIIDLKGICDASPFSEIGFFLILDHLKETLSKRLTQWMHVKRTTKGITGLITGTKAKARKLLIDQLLVAHDIANGMQYLHSKKIIFRDLVSGWRYLKRICLLFVS